MMTIEEKLKCALRWSKNGAPENYDPWYLHSLVKIFSKRNSLSGNQESALDNIIEGFKVDLSKYKP